MKTAANPILAQQAPNPILAQQAPNPILARQAPTAIACLRCQLIGRRKLTCSRGDVCKELPHNFFLGPVLLAGWALTVIFFFLAVS